MLIMTTNSGWIKIHRKIKEKGYYNKSEYVHLWVHLLLEANREDKEFLWNGKIQKINSGQLLTGLNEISKKTGINRSTVDRILKLFENETQIEQQITTKFRLITIKNWSEYQKVETQNETQVRHRRDTDETQMGTNKNIKKYKNIENIYITLSEQIEPLRNSYAPSLVEEFLLYWDETDQKNTPRWKKEKTWDIKKRLERWKKQNDKWAYERSQRQQIKKVEETPKYVNNQIEQINTGFQKLNFNNLN